MKHLTREQRYGIPLMLQEGKIRKDIAKAIGVSTSTIYRELRKNCDMRNGVYNYDLAQRKYETRLKFRGRKPVFTKEIKDIVISLLKEGYSPEQIKGRSNVDGLTMQSFTKKLRAFCSLCPYIAELNPADLCNSQNRISRRFEDVMEDMIYVKSVPKEEKKEPVEVELPF